MLIKQYVYLSFYKDVSPTAGCSNLKTAIVALCSKPCIHKWSRILKIIFSFLITPFFHFKTKTIFALEYDLAKIMTLLVQAFFTTLLFYLMPRFCVKPEQHS